MNFTTTVQNSRREGLVTQQGRYYLPNAGCQTTPLQLFFMKMIAACWYGLIALLHLNLHRFLRVQVTLLHQFFFFEFEDLCLELVLFFRLVRCMAVAQNARSSVRWLTWIANDLNLFFMWSIALGHCSRYYPKTFPWWPLRNEIPGLLREFLVGCTGDVLLT
jgi:hypothetical protein